jgi:hypothetical protein
VFGKLQYWAGWYNFGKIDEGICKACRRHAQLEPSRPCAAASSPSTPAATPTTTRGPRTRSPSCSRLYPWVCNSDGALPDPRQHRGPPRARLEVLRRQ